MIHVSRQNKEANETTRQFAGGVQANNIFA